MSYHDISHVTSHHMTVVTPSRSKELFHMHLTIPGTRETSHNLLLESEFKIQHSFESKVDVCGVWLNLDFKTTCGVCMSLLPFILLDNPVWFWNRSPFSLKGQIRRSGVVKSRFRLRHSIPLVRVVLLKPETLKWIQIGTAIVHSGY